MKQTFLAEPGLSTSAPTVGPQMASPVQDQIVPGTSFPLEIKCCLTLEASSCKLSNQQGIANERKTEPYWENLLNAILRLSRNVQNVSRTKSSAELILGWRMMAPILLRVGSLRGQLRGTSYFKIFYVVF